MQKNTPAKRGATRRAFEIRPDTQPARPDKSCWIIPEREPAPITLGDATVSGGLTDSDVGLPEDPIAQAKAETYILAVIGHQQHKERLARAEARKMSSPAVTVVVPDSAMTLIDKAGWISPIEAGIAAELIRLAARGAPVNPGEVDGVPVCPAEAGPIQVFGGNRARPVRSA